MMSLPIHDFHFLRPLWLLAIVPLLILFFGVMKFRAKQSGWQQVIAPIYISTWLPVKTNPRNKRL